MGSAAGTAQGGRARLISGLASLALHALAAAGVLAVSGVEPPSIPHGPARLTVVTLKAEARPPAPEPEETVHPRAGGEPRPAAPPILAQAPEQSFAAGPAPALPEAPVAQVRQAPALPPPPPPAVRQERAEDGFAAYQQQLWRHIAARRPQGAGLSGEATVRFRLSPAGALLSAEIAGSSGSANLDRIALRTLRLASPMPAPPQGVASERLVFTLPVRFH
ncbi:MAG TPA: TonB family protein [Novosphingobium sp.]|nr:TonB family protein [Novosphingobium sp.]